MSLRSSLKIFHRHRGAKASGQSSNGEPKESRAVSQTLPATPSTVDDNLRLPEHATPSAAAPAPGKLAVIATTPTSLNEPTTVESLSHPPSSPRPHQEQACDDLLHKPELPSILQPTVQASTARDLWREALEKLPKQTQQELNMRDSEQKSQRQLIDEIVKVTKGRQEECEKNFWSFHVGAHVIVVRDYALKIISYLETIGDIAIQFAPPQASIPWSAVKVVMQTPVIESAQMCALLASVEKIVRIVDRGQVYELVYTPENTPKLALDNLQSSLVELYSVSLELLANSSKLFAKNTAARTVYAILHPGETADLFSKLEDLETKLGREVQACESGRNAAAGDRSSRDMELLKGLLRRLDAPLTRVEEGVWALLERVDEEEQLEILEWISPIRYREHHNAVKKARTSDTCEWLLENWRFGEWEDTSSSVILWLQGSLGTGKTFLTSKVIDHVEGLLESSPNHECLAFFYCDRNEKERREPLSVLRSYVRQLSTVSRNPDHMRSKLRALWRETRRKGSGLSFDTCKELLLESVNLYPKTTLVLDALDECEPDSRGRLIAVIEYLLSESKRPLKVFISSRADGDIRDQFRCWSSIEVQATNNQGDIEKFVDENIVKHRRWGNMSPSLRGDIVQTLLDHSKGMFKWAELQIKQLLELEVEADIRSKLGKLPDGLKEAYDEIYGKVAKNEHAKALVDRACMWVTRACKPLKSVELISAIRLDPNDDTFHTADEVDEDLLQDLCNNLLVLDSKQNVWRVSHQSVTEYFESNHWTLHRANCCVARSCLVLLLEAYKNSGPEAKAYTLGDIWSESSAARDILHPAHPLQIYARHHWIIYIQAQEGQEADSMLARLLKAFLGSPGESSLQYRGWYRQIVSERWKEPRTSVFSFPGVDVWEISPDDVAICAMCRFSIYTLLLDWWDNAEIELSQRNLQGDNLLSLAAVAGCKLICENLIKRGIQVNPPLQRGRYGSALAAAAYGGETETVKFLVQKGAKVNMLLQGGVYGSALAAAAHRGKTETVKFLVQEAATDVNLPLQSGDYGSALAAAAASYEGTEVVKFLVQKGAKVNMLLQGGDYGSALAAAAYGGQIEVVKFLVQEAAADVNMPLQSGRFGSALAAAAYWGRIEIVKFLVQEAARGWTQIFKCLVKGAAVDIHQEIRCGRYGSALAAAAYWVWKACAEVLIEAGARVNLRPENRPFSNALQASRADVSQEDRERTFWDRRDEESLKREKAEVAELLKRLQGGIST